MDSPQIHATAHRCPRCASTLISNGRNIWCSAPGCMFGLDKAVGFCPRCNGPLDNVAPGFSIVQGGARVCARCVRPGGEIARARGL